MSLETRTLLGAAAVDGEFKRARQSVTGGPATTLSAAQPSTVQVVFATSASAAHARFQPSRIAAREWSRTVRSTMFPTAAIWNVPQSASGPVTALKPPVATSKTATTPARDASPWAAEWKKRDVELSSMRTVVTSSPSVVANGAPGVMVRPSSEVQSVATPRKALPTVHVTTGARRRVPPVANGIVLHRPAALVLTRFAMTGTPVVRTSVRVRLARAAIARTQMSPTDIIVPETRLTAKEEHVFPPAVLLGANLSIRKTALLAHPIANARVVSALATIAAPQRPAKVKGRTVTLCGTVAARRWSAVSATPAGHARMAIVSRTAGTMFATQVKMSAVVGTTVVGLANVAMPQTVLVVANVNRRAVA